jgi:PilZ domain
MAGRLSPFRGYSRRSGRIARHLDIVLHWRNPNGNSEEIAAETLVLSQHGCRVACPVRLKLRDEVIVWWPERHRDTRARIIFRVLDAQKDFVELGVEFLDTENFWEIDFPPDMSSGDALVG